MQVSGQLRALDSNPLKEPPYELNSRLVGRQSTYGRFGEETIAPYRELNHDSSYA